MDKSKIHLSTGAGLEPVETLTACGSPSAELDCPQTSCFSLRSLSLGARFGDTGIFVSKLRDPGCQVIITYSVLNLSHFGGLLLQACKGGILAPILQMGN